MPANTSRGWPYPLPTEPVTEGAQAIQNVATALNNNPFSLYWIGEWVVTSNTNPITFFTIPQTYRHLLLVAQLRDYGGGALSGFAALRFNADSSAAYSNWQQTTTDAVAAGVAGGTAATFGFLGVVPEAASTSGTFSPILCVIPTYAATGYYKSFLSVSGQHLGGGAGMHLATGGGAWTAASGPAISRIDIWGAANGWLAGSFVSLYGLGK